MNALNQAQAIVAQAYADGDYDYLRTDESERNAASADELGDGLLSFLLRELSDTEGCEDLQTALQRVETAIRDLETVRAALERDIATTGAQKP